MGTVRLKATDGTDVEFVDKMIGSGGMKDVYFSPDRSYVVAFFRDKQDANAKDRLENITKKYRDGIFSQIGGEYWKNLYCWPTKIVEHNGRLGLVAPTYSKCFFFEHGSTQGDSLCLKGEEKQGKWFASAWHQNANLDPKEKGDWLSYFRVCILVSRAVKRLHAAGLAHSDLSYKNVLIDPAGGHANIIDIDGLVVPGKYPPDVVGTPDFIAPEVMTTLKLDKRDPKRKLPCRQTDQHALAVLVYMYLLYRHPLRGRKVHDCDDETRDEELAMGEKALFIENSKDPSNSYDLNWLKKNNPASRYPHLLPWQDLKNLPYTVLGPYLKELFDKAFIEGLHNPSVRPLAGEWETALVKTVDLMQPCQGKGCNQKWFVFDNTSKPVCPFCKTPFKGLLPILNLYSSRGKGKYMPDNHRLMVYNNQSLYLWHVDRNIFPNEKLTDVQRQRVGYFAFHNGRWCFVNQTLTGMKDLTAKQDVKIGTMVVLEDGKQLLLSPEDGGRLVQVQMVQS